ncbi:serine hydrolase domain-containing protein [Amycolatopsis endophytica]|uniref:CubicO group peptidase (Beta-lactamase class C family) n=1 Tax=Amycolatopsis endophytica TaxID=860233 RepID=A0A853BCG5_9PSEU|nr:serine hydrolase domain-containing protein [Amycolatopsis endophytica]NYI93088.1 CubicO group peptidase (beta-lactamase class C family) [Amycolatopsis endophytica]
MTPTATPEEAGLSSEGLDRVDAAVRRKIDDGVIAGAVTLVARHGRIVRTRATGLARRFPREPSRTDTIFRVFSMTKPVTGLAMGILADRGLWKPDDAVADHLPELRNLRVATGFDDRGRPVLADPDHPPTLRELLTHTAGFTYGTDRADPLTPLYRREKPLRARNLDDLVARAGRLPLAFQPGTSWRYSIAMDLQGAIIERLSGQSLPDFFRQHIFEPLGMTDTAFHTPPAKQRRRATLHYTGGPFRLLPVPNPVFGDSSRPPEAAFGGMGLVSTVGDYARFAQLLLNRGDWHGRRIVSAEAVTAQMTNQLPEDLLARGFRAGHMYLRPGFGYGYNGAVFHDPALAGAPVGRGTYQWDGAAGTWFWVDPEHDLLYVGMIQLLSYTAPPLQKMTQALLHDALLDHGRNR